MFEKYLPQKLLMECDLGVMVYRSAHIPLYAVHVRKLMVDAVDANLSMASSLAWHGVMIECNSAVKVSLKQPTAMVGKHM